MQALRIENQLTEEDYTRLNFLIAYKSWTMVLVTFFGILSLIGLILNILNPEPGDSHLLPAAFAAVMLLVAPISIWLHARRQYRSQSALHAPVQYTFTDEGFTSVFSTGEATHSWSSLYQVRRYGRWILLYHSTRTANMINIDRFERGDYGHLAAFLRTLKLPGKVKL
jgi:hypothetical protein